MERRKIMDIIAYYLSEYDKNAFESLGYKTQVKGFDEIAALFGKKGSYLRRLRDEYDVVTDSFRRGQCNRLPRSRIIQTARYLRRFSFDEMTGIVKAFLENARQEDGISEEADQDCLMKPADEVKLENILNFRDEYASIKIRTGDQRIRVYKTSIIKQLKLLYEGSCQLCGNKTFDEFDVDVSEAHHIEYFSDSQNNDSSNIIILCPNHHRLIHKLNPVFDRSENCFLFPDGNRLYVQINHHLSK